MDARVDAGDVSVWCVDGRHRIVSFIGRMWMDARILSVLTGRALQCSRFLVRAMIGLITAGMGEMHLCLPSGSQGRASSHLERLRMRTRLMPSLFRT